VKCNYALCRRVFHLRCAIAVHCTLLEARPSTEKGGREDHVDVVSSSHEYWNTLGHLYKMMWLMICSYLFIPSHLITSLHYTSHTRCSRTSDDSPHEISTIIACPEHFRKIDTVKQCFHTFVRNLTVQSTVLYCTSLHCTSLYCASPHYSLFPIPISLEHTADLLF
jgi:hypothetical protein